MSKPMASAWALRRLSEERLIPATTCSLSVIYRFDDVVRLEIEAIATKEILDILAQDATEQTRESEEKKDS